MNMDNHRSTSSAPECTNSYAHRPPSFNRTKKLMLISFPVIVVFTIISFSTLDLIIAKYCMSLYSYVKIRKVLKTMSNFGIAIYYLICSFIFFLFFRYIKKKKIWSNRALFAFSSLSLSNILVMILKFIFGRYRPKMLFKEQLYGFEFFQLKGKITSFPSGHATTIVALMLCLYFIYPKYRVIYFIIALVIVASRVVLCHHYLADVVFGSYLGVISTICLKHFFEKKDLPIQDR